MRFLCTCDCRKTALELEKAESKIRQLQADFEDLWDRFVRLQGRWARTKRGEGHEDRVPDDAPTPLNPADRDAKLNEEILARRRGGIPAQR